MLRRPLELAARSGPWYFVEIGPAQISNHDLHLHSLAIFQKMIFKHCVVPGLLSASLLLQQVSAEVITSEEIQTGLRTWEWREAGVSLQLVQRLPDQTRAFFQGRGFSSPDADAIAQACVFQTIFRNDGKRPLSYDLDDWQIRYRGQHHSLLTRERWAERWQDSEASQAARIALGWALLPTRQHFEPGDYNWGMTSFGLPPGEVFDLTLSLTLNGNPITREIPGIVCAADPPRK
jgi:hypothetical protein